MKKCLVAFVFLVAAGSAFAFGEWHVRGCASARLPKVTFGWICGFARKCADAGLAEAGERCARLAELAESEFDTKDML